MGALTPNYITGYDKGLVKNKKPFLLPNQAWETMENGYVWRGREVKRQGNRFLGRLQRNLEDESLGATTVATTYTFNDVFNTLSLRSTEPNAQFKPSTLVITIGAPDTATFTDNGDGTFLVSGTGVASGSYVDYATGKVVLHLTSATGGAAITADFSYFPGLPGMGIWQKETSAIDTENTIWWDTKYAYRFINQEFEEYIPGTEWRGNNSDFFWAYNYQQSSGTSILFVTNFNNNISTPDLMYFTDGSSWTPFTPAITASINLYQARIIIPYWGRLVILNTWEGATQGGATNFFNRCRFSGPAYGNPTAPDAFSTDVFGRGGSIDAPVDEAITGATFVKNTLIVDFENSTWQLRYVGEYGLPFIWERISSDYGSGSTFSGVLFDNHRLNIGDVAITASNAVGVQRIDLEIPDQVFAFQNEVVQDGAKRVWGTRDYVKELIYWCYPDGTDQSVSNTSITFPNQVLLYNYRENTWAIFRDNVTCFGTFQIQDPGEIGGSTNWDSQDITWDDEETLWTNPAPTKLPGIPVIVKLNQQGYAHQFGTKTQDDGSLSISAVSLSSSINPAENNLLQLTIPNHNLLLFETIYVTGLQFISNSTFLPVATSLNNTIYRVSEIIDEDTIQIQIFLNLGNEQRYVTLGTNTDNWPFTPALASSIYIGSGEIAIFPKLNLISKDINLFQKNGLNTKVSRIDFLIEPQPQSTSVTVNLIVNSNPTYSTNILITNPNMSITNNPNQNQNGMDYQWFPYYQTLVGQFFRIQLTYDDALMNTLSTHQSQFTLYAINAWTRPGGRSVN